MKCFSKKYFFLEFMVKFPFNIIEELKMERPERGVIMTFVLKSWGRGCLNM
jgi:hypothetical protein